MTGRPSIRRLATTCLFVAAASAALAAGGADALVPFKDAAGAAADVSVAFVIDFGGSGTPLVGCVKVPPTDNGYYALSAFLTQEHEAQPIYNNAGLLCSINDIPAGAPGVCGQQTPQGYDFWSYWHGTTGTWQYASTGAFADVTNGDVEGWRFQDPGPDNATAPAPRAAADWSQICSSVVTTTTTTTTSASTPPTTAGSPGTTAPDSSNDTVPPTGVDKQGTATTQPPPSTGSTPSTSRSTTSRHSTKGSTRSTASSRGTTSTTRPSTTTSTRPPSTTSTTGGSQTQALAAAPVSGHGGSGGGSGSAVPFVLGALIVLLLAGTATIGWRRRSGAV